MSKYKAVPTMVGDIRFASQAEARRYRELLLLNKAGQIRCLELQPVFKISVNGRPICKYVADFQYIEGNRLVVEDCKGFRTPIYRLKKKLVEATHGIKIQEIQA